jgi:hypothetical protein
MTANESKQSDEVIRLLTTRACTLEEQRNELLAALIGVVRVADRATVEFDAARTAIAKCVQP